MSALRHALLRRLGRHPRTTGLVLVAPGALWLVAFFLLPVLILLAYSAMPRGAYGGVEPGFTLEHYRRFVDPLYLAILGRTIWLSLLCTVACLLLGYPTAWFIATRGRWKNFLLFLAIVPFWTSSLVRTYAMIFLLRDSGLINHLVVGLGFAAAPLKLLYTEGAVLAGMVFGALPFMILPIHASLEKLDPALLEAAESLGARPWVRFTRVIWPLSLPGVAAGSLLVFVPSLGTFVVPDLLGGARQMMIGNLIQNQFGPARNWPFGSAAAFTVMALVLVAVLLISRLTRPPEREAE